MVDSKLDECVRGNKKLVYWCKATAHARTNAAVLIGAYLVLMKNKTPLEAWQPLSSMGILS